MFKVAVAHSLEFDSAEAVADILEQCKLQLGDLRPQAGLLFAAIDHDFQIILRTIKSVYPEIQLIGGTTDGEISSVHGYADDSIVLMVFCSDEVLFKAGMVDNISQDTVKTVSKAVDSVVSESAQEPAICIAIPSGLIPNKTTQNGDVILEGMRASLGETFPIFGGAAGDQYRVKTTYQFYNEKIFTDALTFLLVYGPLRYSFGVATGRIPIGPKERVTRVDNNIVYEIGGQKALKFYQHYLGDDIIVRDTIIITEYPLAVFEDDGESYYMRAALIDKDAGVLIAAGNVPEGATVQIAHATRDKAAEAAERSVSTSIAGYPGTEPLFAICFSCMVRKQVLGARVEEEYLAFKNSVPNLPVAGFYSYGEIAPLGRNRPARFHNDTFVNLVMGLK